jgi:hypothetical protein
MGEVKNGPQGDQFSRIVILWPIFNLGHFLKTTYVVSSDGNACYLVLVFIPTEQEMDSIDGNARYMNLAWKSKAT